MGRFRKLTYLLATATAVGAISPAFAQQAPEAAQPETRADSADIIVTAQKREERLIDVPQSVSVLSGDDLARLNAVQFRDFANTVPGLSFSTLGAGYNSISLRGVTVGADIGATVGIYVDEVPYGSSGTFADGTNNTLDVGLFDLERIEVLRGPQGTLYGASTMGGLIKYVTTPPNVKDTELSMNLGASTTRFGGISYNGSASANLPIVTDQVALRASGFFSRDGGYIDNIGTGESNVNKSETYGGRLDLLLKPTERLSIRVTGFLQNIDRDGEATVDYSFDGQPLYGDLTQNRLIPERYGQRFRLVSGTIAYDLDFAELTSVTSYQTGRMSYVPDVSPFYVPAFAFAGPFGAIGVLYSADTDKFTQEIRLAGTISDALEWQIGGFYTDEDSSYSQDFLLFDPALQPLPNTLYSYLALSGYEEKAIFSNITWNLTDSFSLSGGLRYAHNTQTFEQIGAGAFGASTPERTAKDGVVTYLANAQYKLRENVSLYARYATGYGPGGPNFTVLDPITGLPSGPPSFGPDTLASYEVGLKAETLDRSFGIDFAMYQIDWDDIQIVTSLPNGFSGRTNAPGGARIRGGELALTARPSRDFTVTGAFAYQNAKLNEASAELGARKGERLPNVPRFTAAINADYTLSSASIRPRIGATLRFVSDRTASFDNAGTYRQFTLPDYTTVDLRAGAEFGLVDVQVFLRNLFDVRGQLSAGNWRGVAQPAILQPRTAGISATVRY